jgi:Barstar (barnase inhibitor)
MFTEADCQGRPDWPLLQNGAVNLFRDSEILARARADLASLGYELAEISCRGSRSSFERQFSDLLRWEDQFGYAPWSGNLNALNDGMRDYPFGASERSALVIDGFHLLASEDAAYAHGLLDILESAARDHLLFGRMLVALIQTDDRSYYAPGLGARCASWNSRERPPLRPRD